MARTNDDTAEIQPDSRPTLAVIAGHVPGAKGARARGEHPASTTWRSKAPPVGDVTPVPAVVTDRKGFVDVFRGFLIAHMALDHASLFFNAGRPPEELAAFPPAEPTDLFQFLTRFTGIPVAPGFCFMAGYMVATTTLARESRGIPPADVTRRLVKRGLVLLAADAIVMGLPRAAMGFYSFMVLSAVGVSLIALALLRNLPTRVLLPAALAILCLHPLLDVSSLPVALRAVLYEPVRTGAFRSMYPLVPWSGIVLLGYVVGRDAPARPNPGVLWLRLAAACLAVFVVIRLIGSYGNAYPYDHVASYRFWQFSKYPPDLPFLAWSFACIFAALTALRAITRHGVPRALRPFVVFGRVPFFFYMVHFYALGVAAALIKTKFGLGGTYVVWALLLAAMAGPCAWFFAWKQRRDRRARGPIRAT